uniref:Ig-like domain-containing protein n=1 Tax=Cyprinus carpio carpio TaxID=630221 RepID=A0A9J8APD8_CYPCA
MFFNFCLTGVLLYDYMADVIPKITALPRSCVVIPCSFKMEKYVARLRVLWVTEGGGYMFHTDPVDVLDNFKGRTRLLGNPDEQNCTVEMDNVQTNDNGSFCFRAEKGNEKYSFYNSCVFIIMQASPDKPVMSSLPEDIEPRTPIAIKCSVNHTCSSHPPQITWSVPTSQESISHSHMGGGVWETVSAVTFIPTGYEERDEIVCTANFWGGRTQENTAFLNIRSKYRLMLMGLLVHVRCFGPFFNMIGQIETVFCDVTVNPFNNNFITGVQGLRLETIGSSIIAPTLVFILICVLAGVFIYKMRHRYNFFLWGGGLILQNVCI